ncbi:MAG: hypothetical protein HKN16_12520 [Saprospiraceae bacterium]|nr:hypothetical protein [Saprospiraceae bacterium]
MARKKGTITRINMGRKIIDDHASNVEYVSLDPRYWRVGEDVFFDATTRVDSRSGLYIAINLSRRS